MIYRLSSSPLRTIAYGSFPANSRGSVAFLSQNVRSTINLNRTYHRGLRKSLEIHAHLWTQAPPSRKNLVRKTGTRGKSADPSNPWMRRRKTDIALILFLSHPRRVGSPRYHVFQIRPASTVRTCTRRPRVLIDHTFEYPHAGRGDL